MKNEPIEFRTFRESCRDVVIQVKQFPFIWSTWEKRGKEHLCKDKGSFELTRNIEGKAYWTILVANLHTGEVESYSRLTGKD